MKSNGKRAIKKVAAQESVSTVKVRREIENAIHIGMSSNDPETQALWAKIPKKGETPTPEELIEYIADNLNSAKVHAANARRSGL